MNTNIVRRLFRLLAWRSPSPPQSPSLGAFALPPELIYMISAHLDDLSAVSLALTCRTLCVLCFPKDLHLHNKEKAELLLWLERKVANVYFCEHCTKLHCWNKRWAKPFEQWWGTSLPCEQRSDHRLLNVSGVCWISYHYARLVMNRHFYGLDHGLPLHKIESSCRDGFREYKNSGRESLKARIIDDRLLLLTTWTMTGRDARLLRAYIDSLGIRLCRHMAIHANNHIPKQLPELDIQRAIPGYFAPCSASLGSCPVCLTDYDIDIHWNQKKKRFFILTYCYRDLGQCRSPSDWSWRSMTSLRAQGITRKELSQDYWLDYGLGVVRDRWTKADNITGSDTGTWVDVPVIPE